VEDRPGGKEPRRSPSRRKTMEYLTRTCLGEHFGIAQAGMENPGQISDSRNHRLVFLFDDILH